MTILIAKYDIIKFVPEYLKISVLSKIRICPLMHTDFIFNLGPMFLVGGVSVVGVWFSS